jgi:hypothetical protein
MNNDQIDDLKQFIAATVSQATSGMATTDDIANMATKDDVNRLEVKIDVLASSVAEALDSHSEAIDQQLKEHSHRITKLEAKTA